MSQETQKYKLKEYNFATDSTQDFVNGVAGVSGNGSKSNMQIIEDEIDRVDNKVRLDGATQTNFNFIPNEVVQEGLVGLVLESTNQFDTKINMNNNFTCQIELNHKKATGNILLFGNVVKYSGFLVYITPDRKLSFQYSDLTTKFYDIYLEYGINKIVVKREKEEIIIRVNDSFVVTEKISGKILPSSKTLRLFLNDSSMGSIASCVCYGRDINSQEIQHNFSVLNNPQSLSALETTDSTGTKVKHLFHSNAQVVSMRDERTLNEFANEVLDWEEKTADASGKIEVGNCKKAWLRNFSIYGNTIKNIANLGTTKATNYFKTITHNNNWAQYDIPFIELDRNKKYKIRYEVIENTLTTSFLFSSSSNVQYVFMEHLFKVDAGQVGIFEREFTPHATNSTKLLRMEVNNNVGIGKIVFRCTITEVAIFSYIPFGLSSTQAIISNNGMKSVFEMVNEEGIKEVIELHKVGDVVDTLTLNEDGSGTWNKTLSEKKELKANIISGWYETTVDVSGLTCFRTIDINDKKIGQKNLIFDRMGVVVDCWSRENPRPYVGCGHYGNNGIYFIVPNDAIGITSEDLGSTKILKCNSYLESNPIYVIYEKLVPTIIHIPKELMPVIQTQQTNILSVDSPVQPSSFKATVPVDKVAVLEKELARIAAIVDTPKNVTLLDNYVEDEYNKNQKEEGVM